MCDGSLLASSFSPPPDLFASRDVASGGGLSGAAGSFGGMLFTPLVGWLVDNISYGPVFAIVSVMHVVSALIVMVMIPRSEADRQFAGLSRMSG